MSKKFVAELPKCDFCGKPATYDAPIHGTGAWAYMCNECLVTQQIQDWQKQMGTEFVLQPETKDKKIVKAEEPGADDLEYWEPIMLGDKDRVITCPECQETRNAKTDTEYTYVCECGLTVKVSQCPFL